MSESLCPMCSQSFDGPAYLVDGHRRYRRRWSRTPLLICPTCYGKPPAERSHGTVGWFDLRARHGGEMPPTPCVHCGRVVIRGADPRLKRVTCSKSCATSLTRTRNGNQGSAAPCVSCGSAITTGRADSRYCGSACRQRAYRERNRNA